MFRQFFFLFFFFLPCLIPPITGVADTQGKYRKGDSNLFLLTLNEDPHRVWVGLQGHHNPRSPELASTIYTAFTFTRVQTIWTKMWMGLTMSFKDNSLTNLYLLFVNELEMSKSLWISHTHWFTCIVPVLSFFLDLLCYI